MGNHDSVCASGIGWSNGSQTRLAIRKAIRRDLQNLIEWYFTLFAFAMFSRLVLCKNQHIKK